MAYPPAGKKKKKENKTKARQTKAVDVIASMPSKEEVMSSLAIGFATQMHKRVAGSEGKATPSSDGKRMKRSSPYERGSEGLGNSFSGLS